MCQPPRLGSILAPWFLLSLFPHSFLTLTHGPPFVRPSSLALLHLPPRSSSSRNPRCKASSYNISSHFSPGYSFRDASLIADTVVKLILSTGSRLNYHRFSLATFRRRANFNERDSRFVRPVSTLRVSLPCYVISKFLDKMQENICNCLVFRRLISYRADRVARPASVFLHWQNKIILFAKITIYCYPSPVACVPAVFPRYAVSFSLDATCLLQGDK